MQTSLRVRAANLGHQARVCPSLRSKRTQQTSDLNVCNGSDTVEEVWFEVIAAARIGGLGHAGERRVSSDRCDRRRHRNQLGELAKVLGGGGEVEFVAGAVRSA